LSEQEFSFKHYYKSILLFGKHINNADTNAGMKAYTAVGQ